MAKLIEAESLAQPTRSTGMSTVTSKPVDEFEDPNFGEKPVSLLVYAKEDQFLVKLSSLGAIYNLVTKKFTLPTMSSFYHSLTIPLQRLFKGRP